MRIIALATLLGASLVLMVLGQTIATSFSVKSGVIDTINLQEGDGSVKNLMVIEAGTHLLNSSADD